MRSVRREPFDRRDGGIRRHRNLCLARAYGAAIEVYRAGAAQAGSATKLSTLQIQNIPDHPQKGHVRGHIHCGGMPIDCQFESHGIDSKRLNWPNAVRLSQWPWYLSPASLPLTYDGGTVGGRTHHYEIRTTWTGNTGQGTADYRAYLRDHDIAGADKQTTIP